MDPNFELMSSVDGMRLQGYRHRPEGAGGDTPRAVISFVHGFSEHMGRYHPMAEAVSKVGIAMNAMDWRCHGLSDGKRGAVSSYEDFFDDLDILIQNTRENFPDIPHFLMGHSMGGGVVLAYRQARSMPRTLGFIVTGPLLRLHKDPPEILYPVVRAMRSLTPRLTLGQAVRGADVSTLENEAQAYENDPLVHGRISAGLALDMIGYGEKALQSAESFIWPLLMMHGAEDKVTCPHATKAFASRAPGAKYIEYAGARHEIHNDISRASVFKDVIDFIDHTLKERGL